MATLTSPKTRSPEFTTQEADANYIDSNQRTGGDSKEVAILPYGAGKGKKAGISIKTSKLSNP